MSSTPPNLDQTLVDWTLSSPRPAENMWGGPIQLTPLKRRIMFNEQTLSDIKIKIGTNEFFAHTLVLVDNSVYFEKALLGEFKDSKQDVIDLGNEDDPDALVAMLKFCYEGIYSRYSYDISSADHHLVMYLLDDLYDISGLRKEASRRFIAALCPVDSGHDSLWITDETIRSIQQILGPDADSFADNSIQQDVYKHVIRFIKLFYKSTYFRGLLADGSMFDESFVSKFNDKIGEIVSDSHHVCHYCYPPSPASGEIRW